MKKTSNNKVISGLCGGISKQFNIDSNVVRVVTFLLCMLIPIFLVIYIILACIIPSDYA